MNDQITMALFCSILIVYNPILLLSQNISYVHKCTLQAIYLFTQLHKYVFTLTYMPRLDFKVLPSCPKKSLNFEL